MSERNSDDPLKARPSLTYADAGVDIDAGNALVDIIKPLIKKTHRQGVLGGIGGFGGMFEIPQGRYTQPVMVSGADGVGTKLKLAIELNRHDTIGIDLVAMCVNDIIVCGAEPLWFLDYYATGKLNVDQAARVVAGIVEGCVQAGAALLGGETAEMPGLYDNQDYDLAGFAVGIVEKSKIIDGATIADGDVVIGLSSSGPHSNGYSLIRRLLSGHDVNDAFDESTLGEVLLTPTRIYASAIKKLNLTHTVKGIAHITGGGLTENIPRILPANLQAIIDREQWVMPPIFHWLQTQGGITNDELLKTFNCGIGMALVVDEKTAATVIDTLNKEAQPAFVIGHIEASRGQPSVRYI
ncbi:MAG: phosphoribosylformylglycinamidine cyclo-ligase [Granulosicoccus sp.]|nr:phosphoribosylformylglycinamidine cyclo-ligase [Granulosicoccus sp.]